MEHTVLTDYFAMNTLKILAKNVFVLKNIHFIISELMEFIFQWILLILTFLLLLLSKK